LGLKTVLKINLGILNFILITKMKKLFFIILIVSFSFSCEYSGDFKNDFIQYQEFKITTEDRNILKEIVESQNKIYDPVVKMLPTTIVRWNYHTDADSGTVLHHVRSAIGYANSLLDYGDRQYFQRAFDVLENAISFQDQDPTSKTYGVFPYFMEEPLATKRTPPDENYAAFTGVNLLDIWMGHHKKLPKKLKKQVKHSLILAARFIQKRNMGHHYTNIALMETYVVYLTAHIFDISDMKIYARNRLQSFYEYTLANKGFTEYNSPGYTILALDILARMKKHIIEVNAKQYIDSLYSIGWQMIARHYHKPSGQWAGPHSRGSSIVSPSFYSILEEASDGKINLGYGKRFNLRIKHQLPSYLFPYFLSPEYPRTEIDTFAKELPQIIGTSYLTDYYSLSTVSISSMWTQRRPFLANWGDIHNPKYLQVRFLKDYFDFSSAGFHSKQDDHSVLAVINFVTDSGDKHSVQDRLIDGKFKAKDLRIRFEFGNHSEPDFLKVPSSNHESFTFSVDKIKFHFQLFFAVFDKYQGYWQKGSDGQNSWIDFIIYSNNDETEFNLIQMNEAVFGFIFSLEVCGDKIVNTKPAYTLKGRRLNACWNNLFLEIPLKPLPKPKHFSF
jgi:hypothetical protein